MYVFGKQYNLCIYFTIFKGVLILFMSKSE